MNITADTETIHSPARQASTLWSSYLTFTLCAGLYLLPFMWIILAGTDEGTLLNGAARVVHGQVFARDFFEVMGPGTFYWLAAFFKLFGVTFLASRICLFVTSLGMALLMYFLTRQVCSRYWTLPILLLAGTSLGVIWPGISHHVDSNFFALLAVVCLVFWNTSRRISLLIGAGALAGVTTCIFQPKGVLLFCALLAWLWLQRRKTSAFWPMLGLLTGGYLAIVALALAYFWSQGALGNLVYANFIFLHKQYNSVNSVAYAYRIFKDYWTVWITARGGKWMAAMAVIMITPFLFVAALPPLLLVIAVQCKWKSVTPEIALYWLSGWALWASECHRADIYHLVFGSPLLIILCIHALTESHRKLADVALQLLVISAVCLSGFNFFMMLSAAGTRTSVTRVGKVAVMGKEATLQLLNQYVLPREEVLIYPSCPTCYFLSATTNPTRYSFLLYHYNTPAQFQEVVDILEDRRIKYVIWDTTFNSKLADIMPGMVPINTKDLIIEPYLESHYTPVKEDRGVCLMERKDEDFAK